MLSKGIDAVKFLPIRVVTGNATLMMRPVSTKKPESDELMLLSDLLPLFPQVSEGCQPIVHGITPPLDTPLAWLAYHCAHPDNFLYIVLAKSS